MFAGLEPVLVKALQDILLALITALAAYVTRAIHLWCQTAKASNEMVKESLLQAATARALDTLDDVIANVIMKTEQTAAGAIRQACADGKITQEEATTQLKALGEEAIDEVINILGSSTYSFLKTLYDDVDAFITSKLEATLGLMKLDGLIPKMPAAPVAEPAPVEEAKAEAAAATE